MFINFDRGYAPTPALRSLPLPQGSQRNYKLPRPSLDYNPVLTAFSNLWPISESQLPLDHRRNWSSGRGEPWTHKRPRARCQSNAKTKTGC